MPHRPHHINPPLPLPPQPISASVPFPHFLYLHNSPMASGYPSKPLNPNADPFLSAPPTFLPPPSPHFVSGYGNLYYPRATSAYAWQFHSFPAVSCYNAWPQVVWPSYQPAVGFGGCAVADSKLGREFVVSSGPSRDIKCPPEWVQKKISSDEDNNADVDDPVEKTVPCSGITTLMIKNIPNQFKRRDLLQLLDRYCQVMNQRRDSRPDFYVSEYDFVYLPMDFMRSWYEGKVSNLGYAFVNFTTSMAASQFCAVYHNYKWDVNVNKKICEITEARIQGKEALKNAFKNKIFWCSNDQYLPVMLSPASNGRRRYRRVNVGRRIARLPRKPLKKLSC
ncbi:meiosis protein mei2-like [Cucurbita moschata]|uniref:Meiosis protein mei2-like n=1 Tax=Cucurbita moschata TaxID=3662 RepID=A0A6J1FEC5_CUCMO|nr:meiosis protein mei2-like [Cucurbita moschata]